MVGDVVEDNREGEKEGKIGVGDWVGVLMTGVVLGAELEGKIEVHVFSVQKKKKKIPRGP